MKKIIALILALMMALSMVACAGNESTESTETVETTEATDVAETSEGVSFTVVVTDLEGNDTTFEYTSDAETVGEVLLEEGLISGTESEYGLYITTVNGITADWDADMTYWAFYIDGEYALTGIDSTEITEGSTYSLVLTNGAEETTEDATAEETAGVTVVGEGATAFSFSIVDLEGAETKYEIHTDETTVGAALLSLQLIEGSDSEYGLYVTAVNGITADWDADQTYWAFYIDGEYAMTGVDVTEIDTDSAYSFVLTKG